MRPETVKWGLVSTIKASAEEVLNFAAHHLEAGAHRLFLYLDSPCPKAQTFLKAHPKIRVFNCTTEFWAKHRKKGRPEKHQTRQTLNATRTYRRQCKDIDWLIHMDVDEFLWSQNPIGDQLQALGPDPLCARVRPLEALSGAPDRFKALLPFDADHETRLHRIFPRFHSYLRGGFLSHTQGKLFAKTGMPEIRFRIHNIFLDGLENPALVELPETDLCHFHTTDWQHWLANYRYRLQHGSYRAELAPPKRHETGSPNLHILLKKLEEAEGVAGLRAFFDETCQGDERLLSRLQEAGLLRHRPLDLQAKRQKHFPDFASGA